MMKHNVICGMGMLVFLLACEKEGEVVPVPVAENHQLTEYLLRFERAAAQRGMVIDLFSLNLTYSIAPIEERSVAGYCAYQNHVATDIVIDKDFFNNASDIFREMVIFHELGHCVLYRGHEESTTASGHCASIMRSGVGDCVDAYSINTRDYYLDELFGDGRE